MVSFLRLIAIVTTSLSWVNWINFCDWSGLFFILRSLISLILSILFFLLFPSFFKSFQMIETMSNLGFWFLRLGPKIFYLKVLYWGALGLNLSVSALSKLITTQAMRVHISDNVTGLKPGFELCSNCFWY